MQMRASRPARPAAVSTEVCAGERAGPPPLAGPPTPLWTAGRAPRLADAPSSACRSSVCRRRRRCCFLLENRADRPASTCRSSHRSRTGCLSTACYVQSDCHSLTEEFWKCHYLLVSFQPCIFLMKYKSGPIHEGGRDSYCHSVNTVPTSHHSILLLLTFLQSVCKRTT